MYENYENWLGQKLDWSIIRKLSDLQTLKNIAESTLKTTSQRNLFNKYWGSSDKPLQGKARSTYEEIITVVRTKVISPRLFNIRSQTYNLQERKEFLERAHNKKVQDIKLPILRRWLTEEEIESLSSRL